MSNAGTKPPSPNLWDIENEHIARRSPVNVWLDEAIPYAKKMAHNLSEKGSQNRANTWSGWVEAFEDVQRYIKKTKKEYPSPADFDIDKLPARFLDPIRNVEKMDISKIPDGHRVTLYLETPMSEIGEHDRPIILSVDIKKLEIKARWRAVPKTSDKSTRTIEFSKTIEFEHPTTLQLHPDGILRDYKNSASRKPKVPKPISRKYPKKPKVPKPISQKYLKKHMQTDESPGPDFTYSAPKKALIVGGTGLGLAVFGGLLVLFLSTKIGSKKIT